MSCPAADSTSGYIFPSLIPSLPVLRFWEGARLSFLPLDLHVFQGKSCGEENVHDEFWTPLDHVLGIESWEKERLKRSMVKLGYVLISNCYVPYVTYLGI